MLLQFNEETKIPDEIEVYDLILFSEKRILTSLDFEKWWSFILRSDHRPQLLEIKNALRKTKFL
jgi:hypothetical protein